jgi:hypothetical protein
MMIVNDGPLLAQTDLQRKADVGAAKDSVAIKSGRSDQLGRTKDGKQTKAFGRPKLACLPNNPLAAVLKGRQKRPMRWSRSKPFSKYRWLWIPAFAGMTGQSFRTIYRRHRRRCH